MNTKQVPAKDVKIGDTFIDPIQHQNTTQVHEVVSRDHFSNVVILRFINYASKNEPWLDRRVFTPKDLITLCLE